MNETVAIASDHGGRELKHLISEFLKSKDITVLDLGVGLDESKSVDYPDFAETLAISVNANEAQKGILICGTGIGMSIAANKIAGIRATLVWDEFTARMARKHNNSNVLCLGERVLNHSRALDLVTIWLDEDFEGDRHQKRLDKITAIESK